MRSAHDDVLALKSLRLPAIKGAVFPSKWRL